MPKKINIFDDTIDIKEAKIQMNMTLFVVEQIPDIAFLDAMEIAARKIREFKFYEYSYKGVVYG